MVGDSVNFIQSYRLFSFCPEERLPILWAWSRREVYGIRDHDTDTIYCCLSLIGPHMLSGKLALRAGLLT